MPHCKLCVLSSCVIASARAAGREAIQKKQRDLMIEPQEWIATRLAAARNDARYGFGFHGVTKSVDCHAACSRSQ